VVGAEFEKMPGFWLPHTDIHQARGVLNSFDKQDVLGHIVAWLVSDIVLPLTRSVSGHALPDPTSLT
jgi:hypothetical protein